MSRHGVRFRETRQVPVPSLLGLTGSEARSRASKEGLRLIEFGEGARVVSQDPMAEIWAPPGAAVTVWLDGPDVPPIPAPRSH
ncbi:PASTA domain-containing protein [Sciscionella marina]|uniref:PASTA domain-containing protein n=1 Tax=Sciscionella marina TaxID=508770 RepID=UPI0012F663B1|nr:PASTA domain-containing protein [Sciscionella marina]